LLSSLSSGVSAFFYEPALGLVHSPQAFAGGLAKGTMSLVQHSLYGLSNTTNRITATMNKGLSSLAALDGRQRPVDGVVSGVRRGVIGLYRAPIDGFHRLGVFGAVVGGIRGIVGVVVLPLAGVFRSAATLSNALRALVSPDDYVGARRVRRPRGRGDFHAGVLAPIGGAALPGLAGAGVYGVCGNGSRVVVVVDDEEDEDDEAHGPFRDDDDGGVHRTALHDRRVDSGDGADASQVRTTATRATALHVAQTGVAASAYRRRRWTARSKYNPAVLQICAAADDVDDVVEVVDGVGVDNCN
jgi:hypothetical protein